MRPGLKQVTTNWLVDVTSQSHLFRKVHIFVIFVKSVKLI